MKIIYKYKGNTKKGFTNLDQHSLKSEMKSFVLLGDESGQFLEYSAIFGVMTPFPEEATRPGEATRSMNFEIPLLGNDYVELYTLCGIDAQGFIKSRMPPYMEPTPQMNLMSRVIASDPIPGSAVEDLEILNLEVAPLLKSLDPRIKASEVIVTPVKNVITILQDDSKPEDEDNINSYLDPNTSIESCGVVRVKKPPGFGCTPKSLELIIEEDTQHENPSFLRSESRILNQAPDYSFGVTAKYKLNEGPWITYEYLATTIEEEDSKDSVYKFRAYPGCNWSDHVRAFLGSIKDSEGRRIMSFRGGGSAYVPFEINTGRGDSNIWFIEGARLNFDYIEDGYYPPNIDGFYPDKDSESQVSVDINRQTTVYFQVNDDSGRFADIIGSIFKVNSEVRSCCYNIWPGY